MSAEPLLRIDFEAALDKVAWSQLQGSWQLPAELARLAVACGARRIAIETAPRGLVLKAPGARLERRAVSDFATVVDRDLDTALRHRAMVALEQRDAFVLSAIACSPLTSLRLSAGAENGMRLELTKAGELRVLRPVSSTFTPPDLVLEVEGLAIDNDRAWRWLAKAGRFSPTPISFNGHRLGGSFYQPLAERCLAIAPAGAEPRGAALRTALAIPRHGGAPRLWLLRHGIIATRATVPGYPAFEAAVEMAPICGPEATGAMLRERLHPYVGALIDAAVDLLLELCATAGALPEEDRARAARLLLEAARKRRRPAEIAGVPVFPLLAGGRQRLVSMDEIGRLVRVEAGGSCALDAIPPGESPQAYALAGRRALMLSEGERAILGELLGAVFSAPPARLRQPLARRWLERLAERVSQLGASRDSEVPEPQLTTAERTFLTRVRTLAGDDVAAVQLRSGAGRARRRGDGTLLLPRHHPTVRAAVGAVARDPAWLYPALVALSTGWEVGSGDARRHWLTRRAAEPRIAK